MIRVVLGIDPGGTGAIAVVNLDTLALVAVVDMPMAGKEVAVPLLADVAWGNEQVVGVAIERVHSMPGQGVSSSFEFGRRFGVVEGYFGARYRATLVTPPTWKASFALNGKDKDEARLYAIKRWPDRAAVFARKKDIGRADAALIALHHAQTGVFGKVGAR